MDMSVRAPVVVGVDGSPESRAAVDLAAWEAHWRGLPLRLVHAYQPPVMYGPSVAFVYDAATPLRYARSLPRTEETRVRQRYPELVVTTVTVVGDPSATLLRECDGAALLVLGSRGMGSFRSLLLGSVSARVALHATVPVIVVRPPAAGADGEPDGVAVGVDGSPNSAAAVEFAFEEADARGTSLTAVYAFTEDRDADRVLAEAVAGWAEKYPDVEVVRRAVHSTDPLRDLLAESADAELLVVGARTRAALGSVSGGAVREARVPVAVIRPR